LKITFSDFIEIGVILFHSVIPNTTTEMNFFWREGRHSVLLVSIGVFCAAQVQCWPVLSVWRCHATACLASPFSLLTTYPTLHRVR